MSRNATAAARRTRCSTASVPIRTGASGRGGSAPAAPRAGHLPHVRAEERRQFLAQTAHADPHGLHAQPAARRAHHRAGLVAARAPQHLLPTRLRRSRAAAGTAGQLAAVTTGQQAGAAGAVVDADQRAPLARRGIVEDGPGEADELLGEHAAARVGAATVDPFQDGPARPLLQARRSHRPQPGAGGERHRGHRRHEDAGNALADAPARPGRRPRCRSGRSPPGRPRRAHRERPRPPGRARGPRRRPGCRPRRATRRGRSQLPAVGQPRRSSRAVSRSAQPATGRAPARCRRGRARRGLPRRTARARSDRSAEAGARR